MASQPPPSTITPERKLARQIEKLLAAGFLADHELRHFIETTFGPVDVPEIGDILNNPENYEAAVLIDLIVTPDAAICRQVESLLEQADLAAGCERSVLSLLPPLMTGRIHFSDHHGGLGKGPGDSLEFTIPPASLERFVAQLKISRKIPPAISRALKERLTERQNYLDARVALRQARTTFTSESIDFFVNFIRNAGNLEEAAGLSDLGLILEILGRHQNQPDPFSALASEKENCLKQVAATTRLEQQLTKKNIETVMMQKNGAGVMADKQSLFQRIGRIDTICLKIFGHRPSPAEAGPETASPASISFLFEKNGSGD